MESSETCEVNVDAAIWEDLLSRSHSDIHDIYQTLEWAGLMKRCYSLIPRFSIFYDDKDISGAQLYFEKRILNSFHAYEAQGGPLWVDMQNKQQPESWIPADDAATRSRSLYMLIRPNPHFASDSVLTQKGFKKSMFYTYVLGLNRDERDIWKGMSKNARNSLRRIEKADLALREGDDWDSWRDFHNLHFLHSRRRGIAPKDLGFFREMHQTFVTKNMAKLFLAYEGTSVVAGMLFLNYKGIMNYFIGASDELKRSYSLNDALMWHAIRWGLNNGIGTIDLGDTWPNPKSHLYTIHKFKEKWGGDLTERSYYIKGNLYRLGRNLVLNSRPVQIAYEHLHESGMI